jgi:ABC-2 type transport system ATP-binding protein
MTDAIYTEHLGRVYKVRHPGKGPREITALTDINLTVKRGELFGLLGSNGAGKTTLIKILTTLLAPSSGTARVNGFDVQTQIKQIRERINMVSGGESSGYGLLTVRENLWLFSQLYGMDTHEANTRIDELLAVVDMTSRAHSKVSELSTGLRQKMNFVRGFITDPDVLFLDEPTLGLDVNAARQLRIFTNHWIRSQPNKTLVLTTHYMAEADELCDRIAIIDKGNVLACDTPANLKRNLQQDVIFRLNVTTDPGTDAVLKNSSGLRRFNVTIVNGHSEVDLALEGDDALPGVLNDLGQKGIHLIALEKREPTLEDAFVKIVGRRLDAEPTEAGE